MFSCTSVMSHQISQTKLIKGHKIYFSDIFRPHFCILAESIHSCPILSNRFHPTKQHSICCRSENCISLAISGQSAACRFDRFVPFVKWKSLLPIRQVRSSIGQSHLISDNGDPVQDCRIDRFVRLVGMVISLTIPH